MIKVRLSEFDIHGLGDEVWDELQSRAETAVSEGVEMIVEAAHRNLSRRKGTKRTAAPAGEPPELDTGGLLRSVKAGKVRRTKYGVRQEYGSAHPAAGLHEFGGTVKRRGKLRRYPARSYLRAAEEQVREAVTQRLEAL